MLLYHLDEHVSHSIAKGLRSRRIDVSTTSDAGLAGASDIDHIKYGPRESRVIFTNDADFLRLAASGQTHAGGLSETVARGG
jgi:predicted nuclease of predicted toxin-antitoxin system